MTRFVNCLCSKPPFLQLTMTLWLSFGLCMLALSDASTFVVNFNNHAQCSCDRTPAVLPFPDVDLPDVMEWQDLNSVFSLSRLLATGSPAQNTNLPTSEAEVANNAAWRQIMTCAGGSIFGNVYAPVDESPTAPIAHYLMFDANGVLAGIMDVTAHLSLIRANGWFPKINGKHVIITWLSNPHDVCDPTARVRQSVGNRVWVQIREAGPNAFYKLPLQRPTGDQWDGACISTMGHHATTFASSFCNPEGYDFVVGLYHPQSGALMGYQIVFTNLYVPSSGWEHPFNAAGSITFDIPHRLECTGKLGEYRFAHGSDHGASIHHWFVSPETLICTDDQGTPISPAAQFTNCPSVNTPEALQQLLGARLTAAAEQRAWSSRAAQLSYADWLANVTSWAIPGETNDATALHFPGTGDWGGKHGGLETFVEYYAAARAEFNKGWSSVIVTDLVGMQVHFDPTGIVSLYSPERHSYREIGERGSDNFVSNIDVFTTFSFWFDGCNVDKITDVTITMQTQSILLGQGSFEAYPALCSVIQEHCVGDLQQYDDVEDCIRFMRSIDLQSCANIGSSFLGNSVACRHLHAFVVPRRPSVHCPHVGKQSPVCHQGQCITELTGPPGDGPPNNVDLVNQYVAAGGVYGNLSPEQTEGIRQLILAARAN